MDSENKAMAMVILLIIICGILFGGSPDLVDAVTYRVAPELYGVAEYPTEATIPNE